MKTGTKTIHALLASVLVLCGARMAMAQNFTPSEYRVTLYEVELSTDGTTWVTVFEDSGGLAVDLADPATFNNAFGQATSVPSGTYDWMRLTLSTTLVWSHPDPPVSLSNQAQVVSGPPGPAPGQMTVYFATYDEGGRPNGPGGGDATSSNPFLLGSPAEIARGTRTTLRMIFVVTDTLEDQGGGSYDLAPPEMFFVSENDSASELSGTFNVVLYNTVKRFEDDGMGGFNTIDWTFMSGHGTLTFDGAGTWSWSGESNDFDLLGGGTGALDTSATASGRYGVNEDGSFWMVATGEPGTMRGAISSDNSMIVATMYDSQSSHLMVFGVSQATGAGVSNLNGGFYFTTYGSEYTGGAPDSMSYSSTFGIVTGDGLGGVTGTADENSLVVTDPTGTPSVTGPTTSLADPFSDTLTINANGTMTNATGELEGGILESGDAAAICFDFSSPYSPRHQFGFLVRQSPASTFNDASLQGTYFGGHFGDVYTGGTSTEFFSGFFSVEFDGAGNATVTTVENREGVITTQTFPQDYSVDSATGIVTFNDAGGGPASDLKGAIGPNAMSFILASDAEPGGTPSDQRFLGLGLRQ